MFIYLLYFEAAALNYAPFCPKPKRKENLSLCWLSTMQAASWVWMGSGEKRTKSWAAAGGGKASRNFQQMPLTADALQNPRRSPLSSEQKKKNRRNKSEDEGRPKLAKLTKLVSSQGCGHLLLIMLSMWQIHKEYNLHNERRLALLPPGRLKWIRISRRTREYRNVSHLNLT